MSSHQFQIINERSHSKIRCVSISKLIKRNYNLRNAKFSEKPKTIARANDT